MVVKSELWAAHRLSARIAWEKNGSKQGIVAGPEGILIQKTGVRLQCQQMGDM